MPKFAIDEVIPKGDDYPVILSFQNGYTNDNIDGTTCALFTNEDNGRKHVVSEIDDMIYAGEEGDVNAYEKTCLLIRNSVTGKVRLVEVGNIELKPVIEEKTNITELNTTKLELSRKFGSKRSKQQVEHQEKLKVNIETVTKQIKNVVKVVKENKIDLQLPAEGSSDDFYIPPIDKTATRAQDIFDIDMILTKEQYDTIGSEIKNKDVTMEYDSFLKELFANREFTLKQKVLALYASTLFYMYKNSIRDISKKSFSVSELSPYLNELVLTNFCQTVNNKRLRPSSYRDKALCHALVLTLLLNNLKVSIDKLAEGVKISPAILTTKAKSCYATIVTVEGKKWIQLKLPLPSNSGFKRRQSAKF